MLTKTLIALTMALTTLASPSLRSSTSHSNNLSKRASYECPGPAPSCQNCTMQENRCLGLASTFVYEEIRSCIVQAQECYFDAENFAIEGRYSCDSAHTTCVADGGDDTFCDKQLSACTACEGAYDTCRGCPEDCVQTAECQDSSVVCFKNAVSLNGTVTPRSPGDA